MFFISVELPPLGDEDIRLHGGKFDEFPPVKATGVDQVTAKVNSSIPSIPAVVDLRKLADQLYRGIFSGSSSTGGIAFLPKPSMTPPPPASSSTPPLPVHR